MWAARPVCYMSPESVSQASRPFFWKMRDEVMAMAAADQRMRSSGVWDAALDLRHAERLKEILAEYGWLDRSVAGEECAQALWLLVQHADHDSEFQQRALAKLSDAVRRGEADARDEAFLIDRIRVNAGQSQVYGTQFYFDKQGLFGPRDIEDVAHLDERRSAIGLEPFEDYRKRMQKRQSELDRSYDQS